MEQIFYKRHLLVYSLLVVVAGCAVMAAVGPAGKWVTTAGLLLDITGLVQLDVSGLFSRELEHYRDEEKFPHGPPSDHARDYGGRPQQRVGSLAKAPTLHGTAHWLLDHRRGLLGSTRRDMAVIEWLPMVPTNVSSAPKDVARAARESC
jgi:hypothetical protein